MCGGPADLLGKQVCSICSGVEGPEYWKAQDRWAEHLAKKQEEEQQWESLMQENYEEKEKL